MISVSCKDEGIWDCNGPKLNLPHNSFCVDPQDKKTSKFSEKIQRQNIRTDGNELLTKHSVCARMRI